MVNCLPLRPLADSKFKFKLGWPCTAALCTSQSVFLLVSLSSSLLSHSLFCSALSSLCPIILSSLLLSFLVACSSLFSTSLLFPPISLHTAVHLIQFISLLPLWCLCFNPPASSLLSSPFSSYQWIHLFPSLSVLILTNISRIATSLIVLFKLKKYYCCDNSAD